MGSGNSRPQTLAADGSKITATAPKGLITTLETRDKLTGDKYSPIFACSRENYPNNHPERNCWDIFEHGVKVATKHSAFGQRTEGPDGTFSDYNFMPFLELKQKALAFGSGCQKFNLIEKSSFPDEEYLPGRELQLLGSVAKNSVEYLILELAVNAFGWTVVPTYRKMGKEALSSIFEQTRMQTLALSNEFVDFFCGVAAEAKIFPKKIISFDQLSVQSESMLKALGCSIHSFIGCIEAGNPQATTTPGVPSSVQALVFTSGTTGIPKGVIVTHNMWVHETLGGIRVLKASSGTPFCSTTTHYSYLPIAHVFEKLLVYFALYSGARVGFGCGDPNKLVEDVQLLKPTFMPTVPRVIRRLLDKVKQGIAQKSALQQSAVNYAIETKLQRLRDSGSFTHDIFDKLMFNRFHELLGGRLITVLNGGAAIDQPSQELFSCLFCVRVASGYGMTETTAGAFITYGDDDSLGSVGETFPWVESRLMSMPEMGYSVKDPLARGELLLRGPTMTPGYFRVPEATKGLIDENGWLHTGDVAQILPWRSLQIIDRASEIFKLSNGFFVSPEKVEAVYLKSKYVSQILVHADKNKDSLVGVVVPDDDTLSLKSFSSKSSEDDDLKKIILEDLREMAAAADFKPFEMLRDIHISEEPFSLENGLLTPTLKTKRSFAVKHFSSIASRVF